MFKMSPAEKTILWIIKGGLFLLPWLPLYISSGMLFPFITGKNFFFRIIVEIIFVLWAGLAVARPEFRPRLTPLFKAITIFFVILFLADLFGPNPYRSFFSNYERMEGFLMLFHLYLFFILLVSVFKTRKDWLIFFHSTITASIVVGFIGLLQKFGFRVSLQGGYRVDSTIGNPTYLAAYLMFHVWLIIILLKDFWHKVWLRVFYVLALIFELLIIYFTATRGASIALFLSAVLLLIASIIYWSRIFGEGRYLYRKFALGVILILLVSPVVFWQVRNASWMPQNSALSRLASISLQDRTTQSRFSIWQMSWRGALERPVLGFGQENYYLVFQKYYDPKLHSSEPWFDRSHNLFFDWLIHAGFPGLISFLSIWAVGFYFLWKIINKSPHSPWDGIVVGVALFSHFVQNIFVFDNLNTYFLFFGFLAFTQFKYLSEFETYPQAVALVQKGVSSGPGRLNPLAYMVMSVLFLVLLIGGYYIHWKPIRASNFLIRALILQQLNSPLDEVRNTFQQALDYHSFGDTEVREQIGNMARTVLGTTKYSPDERKRFAEFAIEELKKEVLHPAKDIKHMIFLAAVFNRAVEFNPQYVTDAENLLRRAIKISPTKQMLYFELAQTYLIQGKNNNAIDELQKAIDLEPSYQQAIAHVMTVAGLAGRNDIIEKFKTRLDVNALDQGVLERIGTIYRSTNDPLNAKKVYARLVEVSPQSAGYHATYATILAELREFDEAILQAEKAAALDNNFAAESAKFIELLRKSKN